MKEFIVSESSWHHRVAKVGGFRRWSNPDICTYTRHFLYGAVTVLFFSAITILATIGAAIGIVDAALGFWVYATTGHFMMGEPGMIFCSLLAVTFGFLLLVIVWMGFYEFKEKRRFTKTNKASKEPGFIGTAYRSIKGKYCIKVKVV